MNSRKELRDFCEDAGHYTRLRNALWRVGHDTYWPDRDWDPRVEDFTEVSLRAVRGLGVKSISIIKAWFDAHSE